MCIYIHIYNLSLLKKLICMILYMIAMTCLLHGCLDPWQRDELVCIIHVQGQVTLAHGT